MRGTAPGALVSLVSRLLVAQAGMSAAEGLAYGRRNLPWLLATALLALVVCGLAVLVRSASQSAWLAAISVEACFVSVGLFRFAYARYLGGTLLGIITLGTLLRPAVARSFAAGRRPHQRGLARHGLAD